MENHGSFKVTQDHHTNPTNRRNTMVPTFTPSTIITHWITDLIHATYCGDLVWELEFPGASNDFLFAVIATTDIEGYKIILSFPKRSDGGPIRFEVAQKQFIASRTITPRETLHLQISELCDCVIAQHRCIKGDSTDILEYHDQRQLLARFSSLLAKQAPKGHPRGHAWEGIA